MTKFFKAIGRWFSGVYDKDLRHAIQFHQSLAQLGGLGITAGIALMTFLVSNLATIESVSYWVDFTVVSVVLLLSAFILLTSLKNLSRYPRVGDEPLN
ncbi:hypothetical protein JVX92_00760 [Microbacterium hominis]|uniref:hypothetical protein n=1 Tax=Microbacterium hominis TaxID=162426 RepID=UPI0019665C78|nr:hypothetical protein [Microbacterium hominis]QRY40859.1 hypothetical protein JVX92_00760 [Microbacterium hominis]